MKIITFVVIILGAVVSLNANPEPLLLGGLLGVHSSASTGISGGGDGLVGTLLSSNGLLGNILSPTNGLLSGLLDNKGLVGALLGGPNGNLLKGSLDDILGAVTGILNKVPCILQKFGLDILIKLLTFVKIDSILGLNLKCQAGRYSTDTLSQLLGNLKLNNLLSSDLDVVLKLASQIDLAKVLDIKTTVSQILCLVTKGLKLDALVKLVTLLGLDTILNISTAYCKDGQPLLSDLIKITGLPLDNLLSQVGCLLDALSVGPVRQLLGQLQLPLLGKLNTVVCNAPGFGELIGSLFQGGLATLQPVICLLKSVPVASDVVKLVEKLGFEKLLRLGNFTCQSGSSTLNSSFLGFVTDILSSFNLDVLGDLSITTIVDLKDLLDSLKGVIDLKGLLNNVVCLIEGLHLEVAIHLIKHFGLTAALGLNDEFCNAVNGTSGDVLSVLLGALGENKIFELLTTFDVSKLFELANFIIKDGKILGLDVLDNLLCIVSEAGLQPVLDILKHSGIGPLLGILNLFCLNGRPIRLNDTLTIFIEAIIACNTGDDEQCKATFQGILDINGCASVCPNCDELQPLSPTASANCNDGCRLKGCVDINSDTAGSLTSG